MIDFKLLNLSLPVPEVLRALGLACAYHWGTRWRGKCPFHASRSPSSRSFKVDTALGKFYCHKCREHGDMLNLWSRLRGVTLVQAAQQLQHEFGPRPGRE